MAVIDSHRAYREALFLRVRPCRSIDPKIQMNRTPRRTYTYSTSPALAGALRLGPAVACAPCSHVRPAQPRRRISHLLRPRGSRLIWSQSSVTTLSAFCASYAVFPRLNVDESLALPVSHLRMSTTAPLLEARCDSTFPLNSHCCTR